jgi:MGT family glycosyltransferase
MTVTTAKDNESSTAPEEVGTGKHLLVWPFPGYGHVNPVLPVVRELVRRGHRVTMPTTPRFAAEAEAAGAEVLPYVSALAGRPLPEVFDADYLAREPLRAMLEAMATIPPVESYFTGREVPDLLLYDSSTYAAGRVLAAKWQRRAIQLYPTFAANEKFQLGPLVGAEFAPELDATHPAFSEFFAWMGELLASHGLAELPMEEFHAPCESSNIVFLPEVFQLESGSFDDRHAFVGPCVEAAPAGERSWQPPAGDDPLVVVSLGSEKNRDAGFFTRCAAAFDGLPWRVVLTLGGGLDPADLGPLPANATAYRWLPHTEVLPHTTVLLSHAGMSSVMRAMHAGVRQVLVPGTPEEHFVARRAVELGAGRLLDPAAADAESLRDAVLAVASDESVGESVQRLREATRNAGGAARAADVVEARLGAPAR